MNNDKIKLMQELIDLYEQVENVTPECTKIIVSDHINKLETRLCSILMFGGDICG